MTPAKSAKYLQQGVKVGGGGGSGRLQGLTIRQQLWGMISRGKAGTCCLQRVSIGRGEVHADEPFWAAKKGCDGVAQEGGSTCHYRKYVEHTPQTVTGMPPVIDAARTGG